jgi:hypothetical protein
VGACNRRGKDMALGKKGIFYTLIAVILASIIIASFAFYSTYRTKSKMFVVETRVKTMERFMDDLEKDIERALYIAGFRSILAIEDNIIANGEYVDDAESSLQEIVINGTLSGEQLNLTMNSSLSAWFESVKMHGREIGIELDYSIIDFEVFQTNPWNVDFNITVALDISDSNGVASWQINDSASSRVSILGFEDPVYTIGSYGRTTRVINKTSLDVAGIDNLKAFLSEKTYMEYSGAPSFLMRLEGDLSSSAYGIETLVDTNVLSFYELGIYDRSGVDYIYFGEQDTTNYNIYNITDVYMAGFQLDEGHVAEYGVDDFKYS